MRSPKTVNLLLEAVIHYNRYNEKKEDIERYAMFELVTYNVMIYAAEDTRILEIILPVTMPSKHDWLLQRACEKGKLDAADYILHNSRSASIWADNDAAFYKACESGNKDLVEYLMCSETLTRHSYANAQKSLNAAVKNANPVEVLQYLRSIGFEDKKGEALMLAVDRGNLAAIKFLMKQEYANTVLEKTIGKGYYVKSYDTLEYLLKERLVSTVKVEPLLDNYPPQSLKDLIAMLKEVEVMERSTKSMATRKVSKL